MTTLPAPGSSPRTRVRRLAENAVTDRDHAYAILDAGLVAHVAVITDGQPFVVPVGYARRGDEVIIHGSSASRLFKTLATGTPTCLTVTLLDGLVLARSLFESSMNYRTVMVLGTPRLVTGEEEIAALLDLSESLMPGRTADARHPLPQELKATITLALPLDEISVKVS
ncbi:MAG: pyridoxamine 5'-phosphate oxidase family protein, partial [Candidatus Nanopelagicales bacterium]|nr:pyridoxamine 5'-phosphate oxidase family protein [Candidatus Nanopelagicales bacterium]